MPIMDDSFAYPKAKRVGFAGAVDDAIERAVAAERERCAKVAETAFEKHQEWEPEAFAAGKEIAAIIRKGEQ